MAEPRLTSEQKTTLRAELAAAMERPTLHNPSVEQARELARLCNDFIAAQERALALPVSPSQTSRTTAKSRRAHDALQRRIVELAEEFVHAASMVDLICRALDEPALEEPAEPDRAEEQLDLLGGGAA